MSKLEELMNALVGGESEDEGHGEHMMKMKKAYKLMKKATKLIGECCEEGEEYEEEDDEEESKAMPVATTVALIFGLWLLVIGLWLLVAIGVALGGLLASPLLPHLLAAPRLPASENSLYFAISKSALGFINPASVDKKNSSSTVKTSCSNSLMLICRAISLCFIGCSWR